MSGTFLWARCPSCHPDISTIPQISQLTDQIDSLDLFTYGHSLKV